MRSLRQVWVMLAFIAVAGGVAVALLFSPNSKPPQETVSPTPTAPEVAETTVQLYWLNNQGDRLVAVPKVFKEKSVTEVLRSALQTLITEVPSDPNLFNAIPSNTKILDLEVKGKEIRLNLSQAFEQGGGTTSIRGRLLQVLYTLTSLEPSAQVYLAIEGKAIDYLGGEGIEVKQPMTRQDYPDTL